MLKRSLCAWITALVLPLAPLAAKAELVIDIIGGAESAIPVAVAPFKWEGDGSPPEDVARIISDNLVRTGQFQSLPRSEFLETPSQQSEVRFANWRALGVDNLIVGEVQPDGDRFRVRYELLDVFGGSRMEGKSFAVPRDAMRTVSHVISDEIYEALLGRPGAFNTRIAYVAMQDRRNGDREWRLVIADADGYYPESILSSSQPIMSPAWSPGGDRLAYVSFENRRSEIYIQEIGSGERERVASFEGINSAPAWSPDGRRLALTLSRGGQTDIYVLELDSGDLRRVTDHWAIDTEATWMPDGRSLLFTSDRGGNPQIYRVNVDNRNVQRVTFEGNYNASPTLSPDGRRVAMVHRTDRGYGIAVQELGENGRFRVLTRGSQDESPSFAPNGAMVLYATRADGRAVLGTASLYGEARQILSTDGERIREPAWSP